MTTDKETIRCISKRYGQTFAEELGLKVARNKPGILFRLLCFSLLASARISHEIALKAARALAKEGLTTAANMQKSTWRQRTDILNRAGYARYDESTSRMLAAMVDTLINDYDGDLRNLRKQAGGDIKEFRRLLQGFKGIGDTGADIFLREVQVAWSEVYPFIDTKATRIASDLDLPRDAKTLSRQVRGKPAFVRLVDGLIRAGFEA